MFDDEHRYGMSISLNVLRHLGLSLYSNTPSVLAEVIANAWDADATEVNVDFDCDARTITIADNGIGMDVSDINKKYLYVGYQKRISDNFRTPKGRKPMGRKGIGKLSLFSIANKFEVYSLKDNRDKEALQMDAEKVEEAIQNEDASAPGKYFPKPIPFNVDISEQGTIIKITELKKLRLTEAAISGLKKRIARRFSFIDGEDEFNIFINTAKVTFEDRDYFHKARFLFQYGNYDYSVHCNNLDSDETGRELVEKREHKFDLDGKPSRKGECQVHGWIGIAHRSNDLDDRGRGGEEDENLNKITIAMRGKVAQEDILQEYRLGGMITKFIYGEIHADFLDEDSKEDIATSSRQKIYEDDPRYRALKAFIKGQLQYIWVKTNEWKAKGGLDKALMNPHIKEWYGRLHPKSLQEEANKIFSGIDQAGIDEQHKNKIYANGVLAFEALRMNYAFDKLKEVEPSNLDKFFEVLADVDAIEAAYYHEIVQERLAVIERLKDTVQEDAKERVLQEYVFDHLWLLDPAWERATQQEHMERTLQKIVEDVPQKGESVRVDIRYRKVSGAHVIIELKRASVKQSKTALEEQVRKYISAVEGELKKHGEERKYPIESICIVGKLPQGWDDEESRKKDEESLRPYSIRILTYDELINNAYSAYSKFLGARESTGVLRKLIENIESHTPTDE